MVISRENLIMILLLFAIKEIDIKIEYPPNLRVPDQRIFSYRRPEMRP